jgi:hypothetical protein
MPKLQRAIFRAGLIGLCALGGTGVHSQQVKDPTTPEQATILAKLSPKEIAAVNACKAAGPPFPVSAAQMRICVETVTVRPADWVNRLGLASFGLTKNTISVALCDSCKLQVTAMCTAPVKDASELRGKKILTVDLKSSTMVLDAVKRLGADARSSTFGDWSPVLLERKAADCLAMPSLLE